MSLLFFLAAVCCSKGEPVYRMELLPCDPVLNDSSEYVVVLGDLQEYTGNHRYRPWLQHTMDWIWSQYRFGRKIRCILQVGDATSDNSVGNWEVFMYHYRQVGRDIPLIVCPGNHDYTWNDGIWLIEDRYSTLFSEYITYEDTPVVVVDRFEPGRTENAVIELTLGGERCYVLVLEYGARDAVLEWAARHVGSHPGRRFLLLTHEFLSVKGGRISLGSSAGEQFVGQSYNTPEEIWKKLIYDNDRIVGVLCGHNGFVQRAFSENAAGRDVPQILFNVQYQDNGGDGWIQLWEFPSGSDTVSVRTYNTVRSEILRDSNGTFRFRWREGGKRPASCGGVMVKKRKICKRSL